MRVERPEIPIAGALGLVPDIKTFEMRLDGWWSDQLLATLVAALDHYDGGTAKHSERVAGLAVELALEVGYELDSPELAEIRRGALMHDIGKLGVSLEILRKAGPLDDAEWAEMYLHPELGYSMFKDIPPLMGTAEMILASHERWDGGGYPSGLTGEESPLGARIFALADAWDAMTSHRPYRDALAFDVVVEEVRGNAGTQFDPQAVVALERRLRSPESLWLRGHDQEAA
ncbi:MAG TPA: HD-GYP domain-containing protein [Dehalococcoidia bacterium]|nr:HD-GYP domain-containing protein [Dehalococcoidia bacterium]